MSQTQTLLAKLIEEQVNHSVVTAISHHTDKAAEALVRELLKDAEFTRELKALLREAFRKTLAGLSATATARPAAEGKGG